MEPIPNSEVVKEKRKSNKHFSRFMKRLDGKNHRSGRPESKEEEKRKNKSIKSIPRSLEHDNDSARAYVRRQSNQRRKIGSFRKYIEEITSPQKVRNISSNIEVLNQFEQSQRVIEEIPSHEEPETSSSPVSHQSTSGIVRGGMPPHSSRGPARTVVSPREEKREFLEDVQMPNSAVVESISEKNNSKHIRAFPKVSFDSRHNDWEGIPGSTTSLKYPKSDAIAIKTQSKHDDNTLHQLIRIPKPAPRSDLNRFEFEQKPTPKQRSLRLSSAEVHTDPEDVTKPVFISDNAIEKGRHGYPQHDVSYKDERSEDIKRIKHKSVKSAGNSPFPSPKSHVVSPRRLGKSLNAIFKSPKKFAKELSNSGTTDDDAKGRDFGRSASEEEIEMDERREIKEEQRKKEEEMFNIRMMEEAEMETRNDENKLKLTVRGAYVVTDDIIEEDHGITSPSRALRGIKKRFSTIGRRVNVRKSLSSYLDDPGRESGETTTRTDQNEEDSRLRRKKPARVKRALSLRVSMSFLRKDREHRKRDKSDPTEDGNLQQSQYESDERLWARDSDYVFTLETNKSPTRDKINDKPAIKEKSIFSPRKFAQELKKNPLTTRSKVFLTAKMKKRNRREEKRYATIGGKLDVGRSRSAWRSHSIGDDGNDGDDVIEDIKMSSKDLNRQSALAEDWDKVTDFGGILYNRRTVSASQETHRYKYDVSTIPRPKSWDSILNPPKSTSERHIADDIFDDVISEKQHDADVDDVTEDSIPFDTPSLPSSFSEILPHVINIYDDVYTPTVTRHLGPTEGGDSRFIESSLHSLDSSAYEKPEMWKKIGDDDLPTTSSQASDAKLSSPVVYEKEKEVEYVTMKSVDVKLQDGTGEQSEIKENTESRVNTNEISSNQSLNENVSEYDEMRPINVVTMKKVDVTKDEMKAIPVRNTIALRTAVIMINHNATDYPIKRELDSSTNSQETTETNFCIYSKVNKLKKCSKEINPDQCHSCETIKGTQSGFHSSGPCDVIDLDDVITASDDVGAMHVINEITSYNHNEEIENKTPTADSKITDCDVINDVAEAKLINKNLKKLHVSFDKPATYEEADINENDMSFLTWSNFDNEEIIDHDYFSVTSPHSGATPKRPPAAILYRNNNMKRSQKRHSIVEYDYVRYEKSLEIRHGHCSLSVPYITTSKLTETSSLENSGDIYVSDCYGECIDVYSSTGKHKSSLNVPGCPRGLTSYTSRHVLCTSSVSGQVYVVDVVRGSISRRIGRSAGIQHPRYVTIHPSNQAFVTSDVRYLGNWVISMFDTRTGDVTMAIAPSDNANVRLGWPGFLNFRNDSDELYVSDSESNGVYVYDVRNARTPIMKIGEGGEEDGQLLHPCGVAHIPGGKITINSAPRGSVLVADWGNNRVSAFDTLTGQFQCHVIGDRNRRDSDILEHPYDITLDAYGAIYLTESETNNIKVFRPL